MSKALQPGPEEIFAAFTARCQACRACDLAETRRNVVVYRGAIQAPLVILGEGPGADEDATGLPFVGRSGKLLNYLLLANGFQEEDYHIANIVKCRPPQNRRPRPEEAQACRRLLEEQLSLVRARYLFLLGSSAYQYLTGEKGSISRMRGQFFKYQSYRALASFHPAYILRDNRQRIHLWNDICQLRRAMEEDGLLAPLSFQPEMPQGSMR